jgi:tellurite resistance protein TerC
VYFLYGRNWLDWNDVYWRQQNPETALTGAKAAQQYFLGYLLEQSLSVDNMFVIATIFAYFRVPMNQQHRVLFWGIMGALILRGVMIAAGYLLLERFAWMIYVFGVALILTAIKMYFTGDEQVHPERNLAVRLARRLYPVSTRYDGQHFFVMAESPGGSLQRAITPLFLALLLVETSDVMFAIDSIPAIFAVTSDPFIVFTSNVFAICGLRSLYFALAGLMDKFRYLKYSLVIILAYVGVKMLLTHSPWKISNEVSLGVIAGVLLIGIVVSIIADRRQERRETRSADQP